ncbi:MAG TPA: helix-turn-helix domain-containing protein [Mycobacteriales bacterium]|nr:helix-turn-helix domain-containing protein [Mycobacteriales bacterium]
MTQAGTTTAVDAAQHTLRTLIERLHPALFELVTAPRGLDVAVADPVILDPAESVVADPGAIVLAVGTDTDRALGSLLRGLGGTDVAAAVVKRAEPPDESVVSAAGEAGVALLLAPPGLSWGQLYTLLLTATSTAPADAGGVPEAPLGDLFALANAIAGVVGGATTIEDANNRVLAYSNLDHPIDPARQETILGRQVPDSWIQRLHDAGVFRRLWHTDEVVRIADFTDADESYLSRIAIAVRAGGELLGSIWVIEGSHPLGEEAERTLRDSADIAALHLLKHRAAVDVDRQRRAEALLALLGGSDRGGIAREVLAIDTTRPTVVVAFDVGGGAEASTVVATQRVADLVAVYCESYRRQAVAAASGRRVYALLPTGEDAEAAASFAHAIVDRAAKALRLDLRAGIGSPAESLDAVAASRREADEVVAVLTAMPDRRVASIGAVRAQVILQRLRDLAGRDPGLSAGKVAALAEQDAAKGTSWVQTLRAYFDAFGDMASAAAMVNVHPNTFRYRLRRITEVFGLDLDDPDERLVAELQLRFLDIS